MPVLLHLMVHYTVPVAVLEKILLIKLCVVFMVSMISLFLFLFHPLYIDFTSTLMALHDIVKYAKELCGVMIVCFAKIMQNQSQKLNLNLRKNPRRFMIMTVNEVLHFRSRNLLKLQDVLNRVMKFNKPLTLYLSLMSSLPIKNYF
ncbi:hypothetical protein [Bradybaena similaris medionivirus]|nr:hypothetical protein [Bradybaena similaris medionivirus]